MENTEQLFVRACKHRKSSQRLQSVYRRVYGTDQHADLHIAKILAQICDERLNITVSDLVNDFNPENLWKYGVSKTDDHWAATVKILTSKIRLSNADKFPGFRPPAIFRHDRLESRMH